MEKCNICGTTLQILFHTSLYCPNDCDQNNNDNNSNILTINGINFYYDPACQHTFRYDGNGNTERGKVVLSENFVKKFVLHFKLGSIYPIGPHLSTIILEIDKQKHTYTMMGIPRITFTSKDMRSIADFWSNYL